VSQQMNSINFKGRSYPDHCCYCLLPIENTAVILLNTNLIFCNTECVVSFVDSRSASIVIGEEGGLQCMVS